MSATTVYHNMKKKSFEELLYTINGNQPVGHCKHYERDWGCGSENPIHLYYDRKDRHLGTWHEGKCWTFDETFRDLAEENKKLRGEK